MGADRDIAKLGPIIKPWYLKLVTDLAADPQPIIGRLIEGWRDPAYQDQLVANHITHVCSAKDLHCAMQFNPLTQQKQPAAKAFDLGIFETSGTYVSNGRDPRYVRAGQLWRQYATLPDAPAGMLWGGDFVHAAKDWDHFQVS